MSISQESPAFRVIELFEQQEHVAATLSAQALALAAIPANPDALDTFLPGTDELLDPQELLSATESLRARQRSFAAWLESIAAEAQEQRAKLAREREALCSSIVAAQRAQGELQALASELSMTQSKLQAGLAKRAAMTVADAEHSASSSVSHSLQSAEAPAAAAETASGVGGLGGPGGVVRLNVGGHVRR